MECNVFLSAMNVTVSLCRKFTGASHRADVTIIMMTLSLLIMLMSSSSLASGKSPATGPDGYCTATSRTAISVAISWTSLSEYVDRDYPNWYDVQCNCSDANSMVDIATYNTSAAVNGLRASTTYGFLVREWSGHSGSLIGWNACYVTTLAGVLRGIRLANSTLATEGRLELSYDGVWGTVCDDMFDDHAASVACRMLGFGGGGVTRGNRHGAGTGSMNIWLDNVRCEGDETSIVYCSHNELGDNNCGHSEDVSVECYYGQEVPVTSDITTVMRISMPSETSLPSLYADTDNDVDNITQDQRLSCQRKRSGLVAGVVLLTVIGVSLLGAIIVVAVRLIADVRRLPAPPSLHKQSSVEATYEQINIIPRPMSVSVSSATAEPTVNDHPRTFAEPAPRSVVIKDEYEQPRPESIRESWATEFSDESVYENEK